MRIQGTIEAEFNFLSSKKKNEYMIVDERNRSH